jgi:hypothetical protein
MGPVPGVGRSLLVAVRAPFADGVQAAPLLSRGAGVEGAAPVLEMVDDSLAVLGWLAAGGSESGLMAIAGGPAPTC